MQTTFFTVALAGIFTLQSIPRVALLISGTGQPVLAGLFWLLVGAAPPDNAGIIRGLAGCWSASIHCTHWP